MPYYLLPDSTLFSTEETSIESIIALGYSDDIEIISDEEAAVLDPSLTEEF